MTAAIKDDTIIQAIRASRGLIEVAARSIGCNASTIYYRKAKSERVRAALESAREHTKDVAEAALFSAIVRGEAWAVCFYLKTQAKDRGYIERVEVDLRDRIQDEARKLAAVNDLDADAIIERANALVKAAQTS